MTIHEAKRLLVAEILDKRVIQGSISISGNDGQNKRIEIRVLLDKDLETVSALAKRFVPEEVPVNIALAPQRKLMTQATPPATRRKASS